MHIEEVESIWSAIAEDDDWQPLHAKIDDVRRMGAAHWMARPPFQDR
jgi:serine/tyrosine/threonine adenylyltransferase